jgi:hypothetical protein
MTYIATNTDDLSDFMFHRDTSADARHTSGTRKRTISLLRLNLEVWRLIGVQCTPKCHGTVVDDSANSGLAGERCSHT